MKLLNEIALSDVHLVDPWTSARMGTLLQLLVQDKPAIGLRCNYEVINKTLDAIVIVAGDKAGKLVVAEYVRGPAFDVSKLVELVARNPGVLPAQRELTAVGTLFQDGDQHFIWTNVLEGSGSGFIRLSDGKYFNFLQSDQNVKIALGIGVRMRAKSD